MACVSARVDSIDARLEAMDKRFDGNDKRFESIDKKFEAVYARFDAIEKKIDVLREEMRGLYQKGLILIEEQVHHNRVAFEALTAMINRQDRMEKTLNDDR